MRRQEAIERLTQLSIEGLANGDHINDVLETFIREALEFGHVGFNSMSTAQLERHLWDALGDWDALGNDNSITITD